MTLGLLDEACPVSLEMLGTLYRADEEQLAEILAGIPATTRAQLGYLRFPLGGLASKTETRALAQRYGLPVAEKPDSVVLYRTFGLTPAALATVSCRCLR